MASSACCWQTRQAWHEPHSRHSTASGCTSQWLSHTQCSVQRMSRQVSLDRSMFPPVAPAAGTPAPPATAAAGTRALSKLYVLLTLFILCRARPRAAGQPSVVQHAAWMMAAAAQRSSNAVKRRIAAEVSWCLLACSAEHLIKAARLFSMGHSNQTQQRMLTSLNMCLLCPLSSAGQ